MRRVVITGIGPVTSIGIGKDDFFDSILNNRICLKPIPEIFERGYTFKSRYYSPCPEVDLAEYGFPQYYGKVTQGEDKMALIASFLALQDAGFKVHKGENGFIASELRNCGVIVGIGISSLETGFHSYLAHIVKDTSEIPKALDTVKIRYNRMVVPMLMPNSVSSWISITYGLKGTSYTVNAACASGIFAIGNAYQKVKYGPEDVVLTGGVEYLSDSFGGIMRGFDVLGVLTQSPDGVPYPFSKASTGFLLSQGAACILVLEEYQHAINRGAPMYAEIIDFQSNSDAYNIVQMDPAGTQIKQLLRNLMHGQRIDYLNAHGSGTLGNDGIEAEAIAEVFGPKERQPYINSTKGILGHTLGASGALETAVTALSIRKAQVHGNSVPDPRENLNLVDKSIESEVNIAISTSYGFGGHNAGIVLKKHEQ
ncbi:MAG: beta-ketoacyl-[acyl-carrier-protein] synthase family protein [Candidatus Omnitrophota bacterium]